MKKTFLLLLLFTVSLSAQVGTGNISLEEVLEEMYPGDNHTSLSLLTAINYANVNGNWDPTYSGSKNSLLNFRGYTKVPPHALYNELSSQVNGEIIVSKTPEHIKCNVETNGAFAEGFAVNVYTSVDSNTTAPYLIGTILYMSSAVHNVLNSSGTYAHNPYGGAWSLGDKFYIYTVVAGVVTEVFISTNITSSPSCVP